MSPVVASLVAEFSAEGVQTVKNGFAEISKAAETANNRIKQFSKEQETAAKSYMAVQKQKERAEAAALKDQQHRMASFAAVQKQRMKEEAQAAAQTQAMWNKIGMVALAAGAATVKFGVDSYKTYQNYSASIRDLSYISGQGAEETSRFVQVLDDFQISAEDVTAATRFMTKQGLAPTIETVAKLSDEYMKLGSAQEKNEFILKNLGRSGMQWVNVLNQGGNALRNMGEDVNQNLILTDEQVKNSERSRLAMDTLSDSWEGFKVTVGSTIGEAIINIDELGKKQEWMKQATGLTMDQIQRSGRAASLTALYERGQAMTEFYRKQAMAQTQTIGAAGIAYTPIDASQYIQGGMQITQVNAQFADQTAKLNEELAKEQEQLDRLARWGYSPLGNTMKQQQKRVDEVKGALQDLGQAQEQSTAQLMMGFLETSEASDEEKLKFAQASGLITQEAYNQQTALMGIADAFNQGKLSAEQAAEMANQVMQNLENLDGMSVDAYINLWVNDHSEGLALDAIKGTGGGPGKTVKSEKVKASGGQLSRDWTLVGDAGPELISPSGYVYTNSQTRAIMSHGFKPGRSFRVGGQLGDPNYDPTDVLVFGPTGSSNPVDSYSSPERGGNSSAAVHAVARSIAEPIMTGISQEVARQQVAMTMALSASVNQTRKTNDLLAALLAKTPTAGGIGREVAVNSVTYK